MRLASSPMLVRALSAQSDRVANDKAPCNAHDADPVKVRTNFVCFLPMPIDFRKVSIVLAIVLWNASRASAGQRIFATTTARVTTCRLSLVFIWGLQGVLELDPTSTSRPMS